tara:strand:- start:946 stop:1587 length:642 start_codon:yes stop_codon:yes gene_type:complete
MEQSIESIWKTGFIDKGALIAPKVNNLYERKSTHLIDNFNRMFKINLNAIFIMSLVVLIGSYFVKIPVMGVGYFLLLNVILLVNRKLVKDLKKVDKNENSYGYLKSFNTWLTHQIDVNIKLARVYYPLFYLFMVLGFWFSTVDASIIENVLGETHIIYYAYGIPVYWVVGNGVIMILIRLFAKRLYKLDANLVYGRMFKKLKEIVSDIEELRA